MQFQLHLFKYLWDMTVALALAPAPANALSKHWRVFTAEVQ